MSVSSQQFVSVISSLTGEKPIGDECEQLVTRRAPG
jgi:hypothetical protein